MEIGIYLPNLLPGVGAHEAAEWARRAESLGLDALGLTPDGADDPVQPVEAAEATVAVTERMTLFGDITYGPGWRADVQVEHTALMDGLTGGRYTSSLTLAADLDDESGLDAQLAELNPIRATDRLLIGGPLIGGPADVAARPVADHGNGWFQRAGTPEQCAAGLDLVTTGWRCRGTSRPPDRLRRVPLRARRRRAGCCRDAAHPLPRRARRGVRRRGHRR